MHLLDLLHQKIELFRLEQRYTRRRNRRSTFVSEAQYVDGEYIYSPNSAYSTSNRNQNSSSDSDNEEQRTSTSAAWNTKTEISAGNGRGMNKSSSGSKRRSIMGAALDWRKGKDVDNRAPSRVSVREVRWDSRT